MLENVFVRHHQISYDGMGTLLKLKWNYLQSNYPKAGSMIVPIEGNLREALLPMIYGGEEANNGIREIIIHIKCGDLGITYTFKKEGRKNRILAARCRELVVYLLGGTELNYVGHWSCIRKACGEDRK